MSQEEAFAARVGTTLNGKWKLERLLGAGGMAAVYVGVHRIGRRDAIKILHPEIARSRELRVRFEQEAQAVNRFSHPGAVEIRDIDVTEDGAPFLVMELLDGEPLSARLAGDAPFPEPELLRLADELLAVLAAAHARGIIHRDIKPDNLFLLRDGRLKVLDFGIARVKDAGHSMHTKTGAALGTLAYMSPEQIRGLEIDARADLFSVGATLFRLLTRRRIHDARSESELIVKMATQPAPPLASVIPSVSPALAAIVDRALAFDRDKRYPDALAMQRDVQAARAGALLSPAALLASVAGAASPAPPAVSAPGRSVVVPASGFAAHAGAQDAATIAPGQLSADAVVAAAALAAGGALVGGRDGATRLGAASQGAIVPPTAPSSPGLREPTGGGSPPAPPVSAALPPTFAAGSDAHASPAPPAVEARAADRTGPSRAAFAHTMLAGASSAGARPKDDGTRAAIVAICALGAVALLAAIGTGIYFAGRDGGAAAEARESADAGLAGSPTDPRGAAGAADEESGPPVKGKGKGRGKKTRYIIIEGAD